MKRLKMGSRWRSNKPVVVLVAVVAISITATLLAVGYIHGQATPANTAQLSNADAKGSTSETALDLTASQVSSIKIGTVGTYMFPVEKDAVGSIDFDGDLSVPVFPDYQGTIIEALGQLGAEVQKEETLYTIRSPDLIQAESTLIAAAATYELTNKELTRAKDLKGTNGVSEREFEQAISDQQTAEGALKAARDAVRVFGKTDADIDQMIASRKIDPALVVRSPITGRITARNAQPGFLVQPGNDPAPYVVSDVSKKWMLADAIESDVPFFHLGQEVQVTVMAYPGRVFKGTVSKIYATVDASTHRVTIRSDVIDPRDELRPGMLANFVIQVQKPIESTAIPANGVVREGDGTMTAWVTSDRRHFVQRIVSTGLRRDGQVQILAGLQRGELAVTDGAVFLSNMLEAPPTD